MKRGDVYDAQLSPTEGSEQAGVRPVVIVSRDAINSASPVLVVVPLTTYRSGRKVYPSQVLVPGGEGGLTQDSLALGEQIRAIAKSRLRARRGSVTTSSLERVEQALLITLDLSRP